MAAIPNPPIFDEAHPPADQQTLVWDAATGQWKAVAITAAAVTVPQAHQADTAAPAALTAATVATANAAAQSGSYVQADVQTIAALANSLKTQLNAVIADNVTLRTELAQLTTDHNAVDAKLQTAGILAPS